MLQRAASPYVGFDDFAVQALGVKKKGRRLQKLAPDEELIISRIEAGTSNGEDIVKETKISVSKFNQVITLLELKNIVKPLGCNRWTLV